MRPLPPNLQQRLLDAAGTARVMVEARVETAADIRQRADQWTAADGWPIANLETLADGGLRLKATAGAAVGPTTVTSSATYFRAFEGGVVAPYIDPIAADGRHRISILAFFQGTQANVLYGSAQAWLNPRFDTTKPKFVQTWSCEIYKVIELNPPSLTTFTLLPVVSAVAPATGEAAGFVVFNFTDASGKVLGFHPEPYNTPRSSGNPFVAQQTTQYVILCHGYQSNGNPATNIGWGYDNAHQAFSVGSGENVLSMQGLDLALVGTGIGTPPGALTSFGIAQMCAFQFVPSTFAASATLTFKTGSPINLGSTPASAPELVGRAETPAGTSVTFQAAVDPAGAFTTYKDGQSTADIGIATQQKYDMQVTLNANAAGDRTPIVRGLGARVVTKTDLGDLAEVVSWNEQTDPITHKSEVEECTIRVLHDGERDYRDAISLLISQNAPAKFYFRVYIGDRALSKDQWLHLDDFFPDDEMLEDAYVDLPCVSSLSLLRQALPVLKSDAVAVPTADSSNPGAWTASTGTSLFPQIADVASDLTSGLPDDTTYIQSVSNPSLADYFATLSSLSTPQQTVGATVQYRAATVGAAQSLQLVISLREGSTTRASRSVTVNVQDTGQGSYTPFQYSLTAAEQASIGNWGNLNFQIRANGTGQLRVGWIRLVVLGLRAPLVYPSSATPGNTPQTCMDDLVTNQVALDARYRGPKYVDTSPALPVAKTIAQQASASTDLTKAKTELDALGWIAGGTFISSQGRLAYKPLYQVTALTDLITGTVTAQYSPLVGPIRAIFPNEEIDPLSVTAGWRQRLPLFGIPWGWNGQNYLGEAQVTNAPALSFYGQSLIDPDVRCPTEISQWISGDGLARGLSARHSQSFGLGLLVWRFRSTYPRPELERGDVVVVQTDRFLAYDPIANRAIAGKVWATGVIVGRYDALGREWAVWIQSLANIRGVSSALAVPTINPQNPLSLGVSGYVGEAAGTAAGDNFNVFWSGSPAVASVKIAVGTTPPAAGTGTLFVGNNGTALIAGPFAFGTVQYVTITPYATVDGSGAAGVAVTVVKTIDGSSITTPFNNQGSMPPIASAPSMTVVAGNPAAGGPWLGLGYAASTLYRPDGSTISIAQPGGGAWFNATAIGAPTLTPSNSGGSLATGTYNVGIAYMKNNAIVLVGTVAQQATVTGPNGSIAISAISAPTPNPYDGWTPVYSGPGGGSAGVSYRGDGLKAFGSGFTITSTAGNPNADTISNIQTALGGGNAGCVYAQGLAASTTYSLYPYVDLSLATLFVVLPGIPPSADSASVAGTQNADQHIPLTLGPLHASVPASGVGNNTSPNQGGKYK
jgi:hypothetical protein